jgi:hypothetical protein
MAITMQGSWTVSVKSKEAAFPQRFVISGAASGNGIYAGDVATPPVFVTGTGWSITIQNNPGAGFIDSDDQITFPVLAGGQYQFDVQSNDAGGDQDFNDLVLTCSMPQSLTDFLIYGNTSYYSGLCFFNPCNLPWLVIDTAAALAQALKNPILREPIQKLYPHRLRVAPPLPPGPTPDPPPFQPMVIPLREQTALPSKSAQSFKVRTEPAKARSTAKQSEASTQVITAVRSFNMAQGAAPTVEFNRLAVAGIIDHLIPLCESGPLAGVVLRFQEYDRTNSELAGGAYSGTGNREDLGVCATDRNGNYIFRFSRSLSDIVGEAFSDVAAGENVVTQVLPDVIAQLLDPMKPTGVCYESAPYWNVPFLQRINICVPKDCIGHLPSACQGEHAVQAVGNILIGAPQIDGSRVGFNNFLGSEGRITAKNTLPGVPQARCAAWAGYLDLFACFLDHPEVAYYTLRHRKLGETNWNFFQEEYKHPKIANINLPNYDGDLVGPQPGASLHIDFGPAIPAPAYLNIENDNAWVLTHRDRKAVISSWLYAPIPGPVQFRIEGYNAAGAKIAAADDTLTLYVDNSSPDFAIDSVNMLGQTGGDCALFTLPSNQLDAPLTIKFKANQLQSFMNDYALSVRKGNISGFGINGNGPGQISGSYAHGDDLICSQFEGTFDDPAHDGFGFVVADIVPQSGPWLEANQQFCTFAVNLSCSVRVTNGYNQAVYSYGPTQYLLGIQK